MRTEQITTPFGRRGVTLALVKRQVDVRQVKAGKRVEKWKVFRDISEARELLGLPSNSLAVLDALLTFYPDNELTDEAQLVVFPSNAQLSLRAHAMPGATLRRHLGLLVDAGIIIRKDSANGKRFARKDASGEIENAFGFDLTPILSRAEELAQLAQKVVAERMAFKKAKEALTISRRDIRKLITAAIEEGAEGNWQVIEDEYVAIVSRVPRSPSLANLIDLLDQLSLLREEVLNLLETQLKTENTSTNDAQNERHIQNSKSDIIHEFESRMENEKSCAKSDKPKLETKSLKAFPLSVVLKACPQVADYGPGGEILSWRDLMSAAVVIRSMLGVSPSAYQEACDAMGPENAATAIACILERAGHINSAGGYLRDLTRRAENGEFSLGPMVMALMRANAGEGKKRA
jgi:replication initiation protein RepC